MDENSNSQEQSSENIAEILNSDKITKKITFKKETLRNLTTMSVREFFDSKMKQDELSAMLEIIINDYYKNHWKH